jgi:carbonic anhydrase
MKKIAVLFSVACMFGAVFSWAAGPAATVSPEDALKLLKEGNGRFIAGTSQHPNSDLQRRNTTATHGQHPFVTVLSCSDSRVPVEMLFDRGVGDVFVIRVAGNVANGDQVGSIEYAVDHLGTPLLLILGHTKCGAVTAVVQAAELHGNIIPIGKSIFPAVITARTSNPKASGDTLVTNAIKANVWQAIEDIYRTSPITAGRVKSGKLKVIGAIYDIESGNVSWIGSHPKEAELLSDKGH